MCADGTSISELCDVSGDAPPATDILYHLRTKFDFDTVELIGNSLLQRDVLELLPEQVEVAIDLHLRPYYGDEDETDGLYYSEAKDGTTAFYAYATLYARVRSKRYTLAVRRLTDGDTASSVLAELLGLLERSTSTSRPSTSTADSTTASVSRCFKRTTTPTSH